MPNEDAALFREIYKELGSLNAKMDDVRHIRDTAERAENTANEANISTRSAHKRIDKLENHNTWLVRLVVAFVVMGVLGAVYTFT